MIITLSKLYLFFICFSNYQQQNLGLSLSHNHQPIPTDGIGRISVTAISKNIHQSRGGLSCLYEATRFSPNTPIVWYLNDTEIRRYGYSSAGSTGWITFIGISNQSVKATLHRDSSGTAIEGVFRCCIQDRSTSSISEFVSVAIYYPVSSVFSTIEVMSRRERIFKVICMANGGQVWQIDVDGPHNSGNEHHQLQVETVGEPQKVGNDNYSASTSVLSGGNDGDVYQCTASNGVAADKTNSVVLRVATDPLLISLSQTSATSVVVEWSQPSGGATVTGYVVHYSDGVTDWAENNTPVSSTYLHVVNLTSGLTYIFTVEALSEHLSGESGPSTISLTGSSVSVSDTLVTPSTTSCVGFRPTPKFFERDYVQVLAIGISLAVVGVCVGVSGLLLATITTVRSKRNGMPITQANEAYGVSESQTCTKTAPMEAEYELIPF